VNGKTPDIVTVVKSSDVVSVNGKILKIEEARLWKLYKPRGLIVSHKDEMNRMSVFDYVAKTFKDVPKVVSVGRLDYNSEGLLLLTNSGRVASMLEHPSSHLSRVYKVRVYGQVWPLYPFSKMGHLGYLPPFLQMRPSMLGEMAKGMTVKGETYAPIQGVVLRGHMDKGQDLRNKNTWLQLTLQEGKVREHRFWQK